jgi:4'-phosphopantetheinyl transferase
MPELVDLAALRLPAGPREIAVYWMTIDVSDAELAVAEASVDAATLARARRMHRPADGRRILLAHALLRQVLSRITGTPPAELVIERRCASCGATDHGRPFLPGGPSFGLSHGGEVVAVAVGPAEASVAIDVEPTQPPERWESVRRHAFTDADWAVTAADPGPQRTALWARKEAVAKAMGLGLELPFTRLHLPASGSALSEVDVGDGDPPAPAGPWAVGDVELAPRHHAAVALRGAPGDWRLVATQRVGVGSGAGA